MRAIRTLGTLSALALLVGCGGGEEGRRSSDRPEGWPAELLTGEGTGPAIYLHEGANSPAVGYVSAGVHVRISGAPEGDRIPVRIDGALKVRGWLAMSRLAARVQQRGKVSGTPAYVGPNDLVGVRGDAGDGNLRVEVAPWLGRANAMTLGPFVGEFPADRLAALEVDPNAEPPTPGEPATLPAGAEVQVYDRPGGSVVATLPALDPPLTVVVIRDRGEWKGVRVGVGPYLVGYMNAALTPAESAPAAGGIVGEAARTGALPERLAAEADRPLWSAPAGTRIRFDGRTVAILAEDGWAREMNRYDTGEVDVFVAVNDQVAIRGMVRGGDLREAEGLPQPAPPAETPTPETPAPETPAPETAQPPAPGPEAYSPEAYTPQPAPPTETPTPETP